MRRAGRTSGLKKIAMDSLKEETTWEFEKDNTFLSLISPDKIKKISGSKASEEIKENYIEEVCLGSPILLVESGEEGGEEEEEEEKGEERQKSCAEQSSASDETMNNISDRLLPPLCSNEMFRRKLNPYNTNGSDSVLPTNTHNLRRSKRIRIKPLEYWRGERVYYKINSSGGFVVGGIISPEQRETRKPKAKVVTKSVPEIENLDINLTFKEHFPQPAVVFDKTSNQEILQECVHNGSSSVFCVSNEILTIYKYLNTPSFTTGKLILNPLKEKGYQYTHTDTLIFHICHGKLLLMLHDQSYYLTDGNYFFIPPGNIYNIRNLLNKECVILFTQLKGKERLDN